MGRIIALSVWYVIYYHNGKLCWNLCSSKNEAERVADNWDHIYPDEGKHYAVSAAQKALLQE